jgi:putative transposase
MSTLQRAYKTELSVNNRQASMLWRHVGAARFAYDWALQRNDEVRTFNMLPVPPLKRPTAIDLHKQLNVLKKDRLAWMYDVSTCAPQEALRDAERAFQNFFAGRARYPRFKRRNAFSGSFRLTGAVGVSATHITLPRLGRLRLKEKGYLPSDAHIRSVTVSHRAGRWYVSVAVDEQHTEPEPVLGSAVGVDLGIGAGNLAVVSDGVTHTHHPDPKALRHQQRTLQRQQRGLSRKHKGSNNRRKALLRLCRTHERISSIRKDALHTLTTSLARTTSAIVVEDLAVQAMLRSKRFGAAVSDAAMAELRRQLEYKTRWYGSRLVVAGRYCPSSKTCSGCGALKAELLLKERTFVCGVCDVRIDRDINAAVNLSRLAVSSADSDNACLSREVADLASATMPGRCSAVMQESDSIRPRGWIV